MLGGRIEMTVEEGWRRQRAQVAYYLQLLEIEAQREAFQRSVDQLNAGLGELRSGFEVPRGVDIERLYFRAKGLTDADHAAYCASMD